MALRELLNAWPVARQRHGDPLGRGAAAQSRRSASLQPRTADADRVVDSICPYCGVGCGQRIFVKDGEITQVEGNPDSPISAGKLCPKGAATRELVTGPAREYTVKYRRPNGTAWEDMALDEAMDRIADRIIATREASWQDLDDRGNTLHRTMGMALLGGATLDNEENYLIKKLATALGAVQIENQARI
jgi:formate dehydrogenase major subunit